MPSLKSTELVSYTRCTQDLDWGDSLTILSI